MKIKKMAYLVSGCVQGVGFRDKVKEKANEMGISCSTENIPPPDGRVFVELQGKWIGIVKMVSWMKSIEGVDNLVCIPGISKESFIPSNDK